MNQLKVVIMAGGGGTRLWPLSRNAKPKQTLNLIGNDTLLRQTYKRLRSGFSPEDMYVTVGSADAPIVQKQLPQIPRQNFSIEPARRDTAPAIGLVATQIAAQHPGAVIAVISSDHFIGNDRTYIRTLKAAASYVERHPRHTAILGVKPSYPETGYGYIQVGAQMATSSSLPVFRVKRFLEKPNLATAKKFISRPDYNWNPGIFFWQVDHLLSLFQRHAPRLSYGLRVIQSSFGTPKYRATIRQHYPRLEKISIDYALMEKLNDIVLLPAAFGWADIGHWRSVKEIIAPGITANANRGRHVSIDARGSLVYALGKQLVATIGLRDQVVVATDDIVLVCPRDRAQEVKQLIAELKKHKKYHRYL